MDELLTTRQAAERVGVTAGRVRQMVADGALPSARLGRDDFIRVADLKLVADRTHGRPPKAKTEAASEAGKKKGGER